MSEALIIIDIQNDYFPGERMDVVNSKEAALTAKILGLYRMRVIKEKA